MGYIFEAEIESIIRAVRIKTIGEDDGIALKKFLSSDIHPAIKAYFKAEVEKMLINERKLEHRSKKFSYSLPEIRSLEEQIDLLLMQNYNFSIQEFESILDESVHFQFNYLCHPQWTLMNFVFGDQRTVTSSHIEKCLLYCVDYTYFPELIKRYIIDHGLAEITYEEFKALIDKIDHEVVAQHSSHELAHMTRALFEFVESGKMVPQVEFEQLTLPINAAIVFFEDKHLLDIFSRLEFERDHNRVIQITVDRLADIIEIVRTKKEETHSELADTPVTSTSDTENSSVELQNDDVTIIAETGQEAEPAEVLGKIEASEPADLPSAVSDEPNEESSVRDIGSRRQGLLDIFSDEERSLFVKKIFSKEEPAFHGAITEISCLGTWKEVARYLDTLFIANNVNPFGKEAVLFTDKLYSHFHAIGIGE